MGQRRERGMGEKGERPLLKMQSRSRFSTPPPPRRSPSRRQLMMWFPRPTLLPICLSPLPSIRLANIFPSVTMADLWLHVILLLSGAFSSSEVSGYIVNIEPSATPAWFLENHPMSLTCSVQTDEDVKLEWLKMGGPIDPDIYKTESWSDVDEDALPYKKLKLTKDRFTQDDLGDYMCAAGELGDSDAMVSVNMLAVFTQGANITEGYDITLHCRPDLEFMHRRITWFKDGVPLEDDRLEVGYNNDTISIEDSKLSDSGEYTCRIEIRPDLPHAQVFEEEIHVSGKPYITTKSQDELKDISNTSIVLRCPAAGYPKPEIFWLRGDEVLEPSDKIKMTTFEGLASAQLEVIHLKKSDFGVYKCTAENSMGKADLTYTVSVNDAASYGADASVETALVSKASVILGLVILMIIKHII